MLRSVALGACALALAACGASPSHTRTTRAHTATASATGTSAAGRPQPPRSPAPKPPSYPRLLPAALATGAISFAPAVTWRGHIAAWVARSRSGVSLMSFDQRYTGLHLHSGTVDAGTLGWRFGPSVGGLERRRLAAAFNGAFRLSTNSGGFEAYGRVAAALRNGLGSIVTYSNGHTDIGTWNHEVPAPGRKVASVRQNLVPLIDHGAAAPTVGCDSCWGATLGGVSDPARSALGITGTGQLVWAAGEHLTVSQLTSALLAAHVTRAVELDINPEWVAGYLYGHRGGNGSLAPVPAVPDQHGIPRQFLAAWSRDFFTVVAR